jgi:hypothetical protein
MKKFWLIIIPFFIAVIISCLDLSGKGPAVQHSTSIDTSMVLSKSDEALKFSKDNNLNTDYCLLADMNRHSGLKRFYIWSFATGSIVNSGVVSHGCCNNPWGGDRSKTSPGFSNTQNSHCSSIGKYKIGPRGVSQWGIKVNYRLEGMDRSNDNAHERDIVLHSWERISNKEPYPSGVPEGWGCPAVSNSYMKELDELLKNAEKPVLLWLYR